MSRTIAIGDIHGEITKLDNLLEKINIDFEKDLVVFLGDYIDRGENPRAVVKRIRDLQEKYPKNVICLRGNHEQMAIDTTTAMGVEMWFYNGGNITNRQYEIDELERDIEWFDTLPYYHETENNIFVHGGIKPNIPLERQNKDFMLWARTDYLYDNRDFKKKVISGHTPSLSRFNKNGEKDKPYMTNGGNWVIDTGACFGGGLTACIIEDNKYSFITQE